MATPIDNEDFMVSQTRNGQMIRLDLAWWSPRDIPECEYYVRTDRIIGFSKYRDADKMRYYVIVDYTVGTESKIEVTQECYARVTGYLFK